MEFEEGQIVLCTVEKIAGTVVFVIIEPNGEGTITTSEISPGRIRNLRDYVVPGKKIVCKILSIKGDKIHLSLRRVKLNEKRELLDKLKQEKSLAAMLKTVLGDKAKTISEKITLDNSLPEFFEKASDNSELLDKYFNKSEKDKIIKILESKKEKAKKIRQIFSLSSKSPNGIIIIKNIMLNSCKDTDCEISYIAAGKYRLTMNGEDFKEMKSRVQKTLNSIEEQAKKQHAEFALEKH